MERIELKVSRIGNSRGVRLPAATLARYRIGAAVQMEELSDGILLRPLHSGPEKLSWQDTALAMAAEREDWSAWDAAAADGLDSIPWDPARPARPARVAEPERKYGRKPKPR